MTLETWIVKGGVVDATNSAIGQSGGDEPANLGTANLIASMAELGYTGTLTAASGGTPAYITVTNKTSTVNDLTKLIHVVKAANAGITYTKGS